MYLPDSKIHVANMGPTWGRQDPGGPYVGPMNLSIRVSFPIYLNLSTICREDPNYKEVGIAPLNFIIW